jgi:hypothetical protein
MPFTVHRRGNDLGHVILLMTLPLRIQASIVARHDRQSPTSP